MSVDSLMSVLFVQSSKVVKEHQSQTHGTEIGIQHPKGCAYLTPQENDPISKRVVPGMRRRGKLAMLHLTSAQVLLSVSRTPDRI